MCCSLRRRLANYSNYHSRSPKVTNAALHANDRAVYGVLQDLKMSRALAVG